MWAGGGWGEIPGLRGIESPPARPQSIPDRTLGARVLPTRLCPPTATYLRRSRVSFPMVPKPFLNQLQPGVPGRDMQRTLILSELNDFPAPL
jgi:hypothetical protein